MYLAFTHFSLFSRSHFSYYNSHFTFPHLKCFLQELIKNTPLRTPRCTCCIFTISLASIIFALLPSTKEGYPDAV